MNRQEIIDQVGRVFLTQNLEKDGEFSYVQAGVPQKMIIANALGQKNFQLDIRFEDESSHLSILVETINVNPSKKDRLLHEQKLLEGYCILEEKIRPNNNMILILADSGDSSLIKVWKKKCGEDKELLSDQKIKTMKEYIGYFSNRGVNNELKLKKSVLELNELLHKCGISEHIRGQFVGTCLLALKSNNFKYKTLDTSLIVAGIRNVIASLLTMNINKAIKITLLDTKVLNNQKVRNLNRDKFEKILDFINEEIIPYINTNSSKGQDLLNLFFTTFNKYVGKADKNQAFTPDHITHFMCKVANVNKNTKVLDPTCGSGSFIVQALIQELYECETEQEENDVKKNNIFGIEIEEKAFGLATTNMLIHGDGNTNVILDDKLGCFGLRDWIQDNNVDVVLMNPPYNAKPIDIPEKIKDSKTQKVVYTIHNWNKKQKEGKEDPTKGFCFVNYIADCVGKDKNNNVRSGKKLLCLLPLSCAIGSKDLIQEEKKKILQNNTLDAVFTLPSEMFYPGANVNSCCMVFTLGQPHFTKTKDNTLVPRKETFFGYFKDDGFIKKKNLGRVSKLDNQKNALWNKIEQLWLDLYNGTKNDQYLGIRKKVSDTDEWLAEAYVETDYTKLTDKDFQETVNNYFAYLIANGYNIYEKIKQVSALRDIKSLHYSSWKEYTISQLFDVSLSKGDIKQGDCSEGSVPLISSGSLNNGIIEKIDEDGDGVAKQFKGNSLTVDMFGQAFYQPQNFYSVSHGRVNVLSCLYNKFNKYSGLFISTIINKEKYRFSYNRAVYSSVINNLKIKLPSKQCGVDENGEPKFQPDWKFMEDYIKGLQYSDLI